MSFKVTEEYVKNLRQELESKDSDLSQIFNEIHAADIAEILTYFTIDEVQRLLEPIKKDLLSSILTYLDESLLNEFLELLSSVEIAELVSESMDTDDAVDIISLLSEEKKHDVLSHVDDLNLAKDLADLLTHAEGTAGALMATELVKVNQNWTVLKCVREMRRQAEGIDVVHAV